MEIRKVTKGNLRKVNKLFSMLFFVVSMMDLPQIESTLDKVNKHLYSNNNKSTSIVLIKGVESQCTQKRNTKKNS